MAGALAFCRKRIFSITRRVKVFGQKNAGSLYDVTKKRYFFWLFSHRSRERFFLVFFAWECYTKLANKGISFKEWMCHTVPEKRDG
jgi:hypothetical protein